MASASQRHSKRHQLQALNPLHRHPAATAPATAPAPSSSLLRADRRGVSKARSGSRGESIVDSSSASDLVDVRDDSPLMDDARVGKGEATMQGMAQMLADRKAEDEELRSSLNGLTKHALTCSRRLDLTYYSLLEHSGSVRANVGQLQNLINEIDSTVTNLNGQADAFRRQVRSQLKSYKNFGAQERRLNELEARFERGKRKANGLRQQLDSVRTTLQQRQESETASWRKTRLRLQIFWGTVLFFVVAITALALVRKLKFAARTHGSKLLENAAITSKLAEISSIAEQLAGTTASQPVTTEPPSADSRAGKNKDRWDRILADL